MKRLVLILLSLMTLSLAAQTKKALTLDDVMWSGRNYWNLAPEYINMAWRGDELLRLEPQKVSLWQTATGKTLEKPQVLFNVEEVNDAVGAVTNIFRNLHNTSFPYAAQPLALVETAAAATLYNYEQKKSEAFWRMPESTQAKAFSPEAKAWALVKDYNLWFMDTKGEAVQITLDGTREIQYGLSVHRDEFGIHGGLFWSPTGKSFAFYRMDQTMVTDFPLADMDHRTAQAAPEKYPMAGETSHEVKVGVCDVKTQQVVYLQTPSPVDRYFTNVQWSPDGKKIYVMELPRSQREMELVQYDAATGARETILYKETHPKYVEPMTPITFLPWDATRFVVLSRRDGFNHFYLYRVDGTLERQLTRGQWEVIESLGFNTKERTIVFAANTDAPTRHGIYSVSVEKGTQRRISDDEGVHSAKLSAATGAYVVDKWSAPAKRVQMDVRTTSQRALKVCQTLQRVDDIWQDFAQPTFEMGTLTAADDSTTLFYRMVKPVGFDAKKKYPAVVYVYGGPHAHCVDESWHYCSRPWEAYMASKGYVLFILDNRGSELRGLNFENVTWQHLGREEMRDQLRGVEFLKSLPYIDANRLGVHGWSFGGFMTSNLMCSYPDVFKVGVAGGPVLDWSLYEVMYGERYMTTPQENPEGYAEANVCEKAKNLKGHLQIIVGLNDPTCVLQHSMKFLRSAIDADVQPDYFVYPSQGHNMNGHDATHLHERITQYFDRNL